MQIKDIMTRDVVTVSPETAIAKVSDLMFTNRFHGVPVTEGKKVVGLITEDDFFLKKFDDIYFPTYLKFLEESQVAEHLPSDLKKKIETLATAKAEDIMTANPLTLSVEDDVATLMDKVKETKFTTFPVVDSEKNIVGIVTLADYLGTVRKGSRQMETRLKEDSDREIDKIAGELGNFWQNGVVVASRKKVRTWKGLTFLGLVAVVLLVIALIFVTKNQVSCGPESSDYVPLECQNFAYSNWNTCNQGIQTRQVIKKFPPHCSGGAMPILTQPCK
ncbi:MAG: CBS domain-containing protein [Candidatus Pacebacteria bacterium]|nr:CBS domain-containing protein [Candidatus Paceibacterota bacterium]MDR3582939.1 CBS domain-containing protein [Candidatus Paceibacterota bacterium]